MSTPKPAPEQKPEPAPEQTFGKKKKRKKRGKKKKKPLITIVNNEVFNGDKNLYIIKSPFIDDKNRVSENARYIQPISDNSGDLIVGSVSVSFLNELMEHIKNLDSKDEITKIIGKFFYNQDNRLSIVAFLIHYISYTSYLNRDKAFETLKKVVDFVKKVPEDIFNKIFKKGDNYIPVWKLESFNTYLEFLLCELEKNKPVIDKTIINLLFYVYGGFKIRIKTKIDEQEQITNILINKQKQMAIEEFMTNCNTVENCSKAIKTFMEAPNGPGAPTTQQSKGQGAPQQPQQSTGQETPKGPQQSKGQGASTSQGASKSDLSNIILRF